MTLFSSGSRGFRPNMKLHQTTIGVLRQFAAEHHADFIEPFFTSRVVESKSDLVGPELV